MFRVGDKVYIPSFKLYGVVSRILDEAPHVYGVRVEGYDALLWMGEDKLTLAQEVCK